MPKYQAYNRKTKRWVIYEFGKNGFQVQNVKERNPNKPFSNVKIKGQRPIKK